ncbi:MAG: GntR family transcriptional regulator [Pseudomonadota bacterium]
MQWNFFLLPKVSVFGEAGLVLQHRRYDNDYGNNCVNNNVCSSISDNGAAPAFAAGGRFLVSDSVGFLLRSVIHTFRPASRSCCRLVREPRPGPRLCTPWNHRAPPSTNIAATIFRDLRSQILKGALKASERLPGERELAAQYGTNRNTLREAVRMLEQARLVTVRHGQGVTRRRFSQDGHDGALAPVLGEYGQPAAEIHALLEDILPARLLVLEFATAWPPSARARMTSRACATSPSC